MPGREILLARSSTDLVSFLTRMRPEEAAELGARARKRALAGHTAAHRAEALEGYLAEISTSRPAPGKAMRKAVTNEAEG